MKGIMTLEDNFCELAEIKGGNTVILCDRGVMDGKAYMKPQAWQVLLDENGFNLVSLRDKRYDSVIHLVTAADGAEEFYKLDNNTARYEVYQAIIDILQYNFFIQRLTRESQLISIEKSETLGLDILHSSNKTLKIAYLNEDGLVSLIMKAKILK